MLCPRSVMALLAVLALSAQVAESDIAAPDTCTAADVGTGFCLTCKTKAKCNTADTPPDPSGDCTTAGEACTVLAGVATCRPIAETACSCDMAAQCDAYDPDFVLICLNGGVTISNDCSTTPGATCVDGACATPATTDTTASPDDVCVDAPDGFVVLTPMCTSAAYCSGGLFVAPYDCEPGEYFDVAEMGCLPSPPVPCTGCETGACPDKSNCSKWYICEGGVVLDEETCDETTPDFDIVAKECLETGTCTGNDGCTYGLTTIAETTPTTVGGGSTDDGSDSTSGGTGSTGDSTSATARPDECTAANVGQRYPYEGDCKKYWSCNLVGTDKYAYVEGACLGTLVFNPNTGFCDTPENVPGCVSTAAA